MFKHQTRMAAGLLSFLTAMVLTIPAYSCTTVFWSNPISKVTARTMDLFVSDDPLIKVEPRGMMRTGDAGKHSLKWRSKYGSVVVTAFHSNAASDGMNEKGLAVHLLYLGSTQYGKNSGNKPEIANLLLGQYVLDNFSTVDAALNAIKKVHVVAIEEHGQKWPIHFMLQDNTGDSAVVEYVKGQLRIYHGPQYDVMTNEPPYNIQLANLKRYKAFGGDLPLPGNASPLSRFVRVASYLKTLPKPKNQAEAVAYILSDIRTAMVPFGATIESTGEKIEDNWPTRWVSVADLTNKVYYFSSTMMPSIIWIDLKKINFSQQFPLRTTSWIKMLRSKQVRACTQGREPRLSPLRIPHRGLCNSKPEWLNFSKNKSVLEIDPINIHLEGDVTSKLAPSYQG